MKKAERAFPPGVSIVPRPWQGPFGPKAGRVSVVFHHSPGALRGRAPKMTASPFVALFQPHRMPRHTAPPEAPALPERYEDALAELEQLVARLESGQLPLDQLLAAYQRGAALLALCQDRLKAVEDQIQVLDNGQMKPWGKA